MKKIICTLLVSMFPVALCVANAEGDQLQKRPAQVNIQQQQEQTDVTTRCEQCDGEEEESCTCCESCKCCDNCEK